MAALIRNADVAADAGIDSAKLAAWSMNRSAGGFKLTNLADGVDPGDAVNKAQLDAVAAGSVAWGSITGTLSNQTDLQAELDGKQDADGTTVGLSFFHLGNPGAITFPQINADNSVSALTAANFRTAIGAGTGSGTVTAVSIASANGVSGSSSGGATPALTIVLGAITPSSVASTGTVTGTNLSGTNTGDQTITLTGEVTGSGTGSFATTITAAAVTYAKIQNVAALSVFGRSANTSGVGADITGSNGQILRVSGTSLGFGSIVPASIAMASGKLLGRSATSAAEEITVGSNLTLSAGTLAAPMTWGTLTGDIADQTDLMVLLGSLAPPFNEANPILTDSFNGKYLRFALDDVSPSRQADIFIQDISTQTMAVWEGENVFQVTQEINTGATGATALIINTGANGVEGIVGIELVNETPADIVTPSQDAPWVLFGAHGYDGALDTFWEMNERFTVTGARSKFIWEFSVDEGPYVEKVSIDSSGAVYAVSYVTADLGFIYGTPGTTGLLTSESISFNAAFGGGLLNSQANTGPFKFNTVNTTVAAFRFNAHATLTSGNLIEGMVANSGFTGSYLLFGRSSTGSSITTTLFEVTSAGVINAGSNILPITDDGSALGSTTKRFSDVFLATGAVLNFNAGNYTVTHSSGVLSFSGKIAPGSDDGAALGDTTHNFSDLFLATGAVINYANSNLTFTHSSTKLTASGTLEATGDPDAGGGARAAFIGTILNANDSLAMTLFQASLGNSNKIFYAIGRSWSNGTAGYMGYVPGSSPSTTAKIMFGFHSHDDLLNVFVTGGVSIGSAVDPGANILNVQGSYRVNTTKVVGARDTGWTAFTGATNKATSYATGTITLIQLAERVAAIQAALTTHGLLGA